MHFSIHEDDNGEWVLRINDTYGYAGLGSFNGKFEAETIRDVLQGALELDECCRGYETNPAMFSQSTPSKKFRGGMKNANNMVEGRKLRELL